MISSSFDIITSLIRKLFPNIKSRLLAVYLLYNHFLSVRYSDSIALTVSGTVSIIRLFISFSSFAPISSVTVNKYFFAISFSTVSIYSIISINIFKYYILVYRIANYMTSKTKKRHLSQRSVLVS